LEVSTRSDPDAHGHKEDASSYTTSIAVKRRESPEQITHGTQGNSGSPNIGQKEAIPTIKLSGHDQPQIRRRFSFEVDEPSTTLAPLAKCASSGEAMNRTPSGAGIQEDRVEVAKSNSTTTLTAYSRGRAESAVSSEAMTESLTAADSQDDRVRVTRSKSTTSLSARSRVNVEGLSGSPSLDVLPSFRSISKVQHSKNTRRKLVIVGDAGCGKTWALISFAKGTLPAVSGPTILEIYVADIEVDGTWVELVLWDTPGIEDYDRLRPTSYRDAHVVLICFSIGSPDSLDNVIAKWAPEVREFCQGLPCILVGLEKDLRNDQSAIEELQRHSQRPVSWLEATKVKEQIGALFYVECSARTKEGLTQAFECAARVALMVKLRKKRGLARFFSSRQ
jgi:small GTP-binding protein